MSFTSKYIITNSSGKTLLDFDLDFADITFRGQSILFSGSNQIDGFFIRHVSLDDDMTKAKAISGALHLSTRNETLVFDGNADSTLDAVNDALGLDDSSIVIAA